MKYIKRAVTILFCVAVIAGTVEVVKAWFNANGWKPLGATDWAAWVQAVGSIAAILGSFIIFKVQHRIDRENDQSRRDENERIAKDSALLARTNAIRNLVQVNFFSLQSASTLIQIARDNGQPWEIEKYMSQIYQLRAVLDSIITSDTDNYAVISALNISMVLTELHNDMRHIGGGMTDRILDRSQDRVDTGFEFLDRLIDLQNNLLKACRERSITFESANFGG